MINSEQTNSEKYSLRVKSTAIYIIALVLLIILSATWFSSSASASVCVVDEGGFVWMNCQEKTSRNLNKRKFLCGSQKIILSKNSAKILSVRNGQCVKNKPQVKVQPLVKEKGKVKKASSLTPKKVAEQTAKTEYPFSSRPKNQTRDFSIPPEAIHLITELKDRLQVNGIRKTIDPHTKNIINKLNQHFQKINTSDKSLQDLKSLLLAPMEGDHIKEAGKTLESILNNKRIKNIQNLLDQPLEDNTLKQLR